MLPPLSIQPLVENAVNHGIIQVAGSGTVTIQINEHLSNIEIVVKDDGRGMSQEKTEQLLNKEIKSGNERTSVGLKNVDSRLKQLYGEGLIIQSSPNRGATVSFYSQRD